MTLTEAEAEATERKKRVEKYFRPTPKKSLDRQATVLLWAGGIAALLGLFTMKGNGFLGFVLLVVGAFAVVDGGRKKREYRKAFEMAEPKPSDREMDELLASDLQTLEERAMYSLGITSEHLEVGAEAWDPVMALLGKHSAARPEKRPLVLYGPELSGFGIGDDGVWRFQRYEILIICPTRHILALFHCSLDFLSGGLSEENTEEYQYAHVVAVSTKTTAVPDDLSLGELNTRTPDNDAVRFSKVQRRRLEVSVSNGQSMGVTVGIMDEKDSSKKARLQLSGIDAVIASVRRVLRGR